MNIVFAIKPLVFDKLKMGTHFTVWFGGGQNAFNWLLLLSFAGAAATIWNSKNIRLFFYFSVEERNYQISSGNASLVRTLSHAHCRRIHYKSCCNSTAFTQLPSVYPHSHFQLVHNTLSHLFFTKII